jgi:hypothetical protein
MSKRDSVARVISKYKLGYDISFSAKMRMMRSKRKTFLGILKAENPGVFALAMAVRMKSLFRAVGVNLSPASSARFAYAVYACVVCVFIAAAFLVSNTALKRGAATHDMAARYGKPAIVMSAGDVRIGIAKTMKPVTKGRALKNNDVIRTGEMSSVCFQNRLFNAALGEKSSALCVSGARKISLSLNDGTVFSKVMPLAADEGFEVLTPNASVHVKGTMFNVSFISDETVVTVTEGTVEVTQRETGEKAMIRAGNTAVVKKQIVVRESGIEDSARINGFAGIGFVDYPTKMSDEETKKIVDILKLIAVPAAHETRSVSMNLEQIKEKYGRIEELYLYDGRMLTGAIVSRGDKIQFITATGMKSIAAKDVKGSKIIR